MKRQTSAATLVAGIGALMLALWVPAGAVHSDSVKQLKETRKCAGCDLRGADLQGVNVELGDLSDADLRGANLYKANLQNADLTGALFTGANLGGADLRGSKGADLIGAETDDKTRCPNGNAGPCQ